MPFSVPLSFNFLPAFPFLPFLSSNPAVLVLAVFWIAVAENSKVWRVPTSMSPSRSQQDKEVDIMNKPSLLLC